MNSCFDDSVCHEFDFLIEQAHKFESKADDIRDEIKAMMYGNALIPYSRGDIMGLLDSIDVMPSQMESSLFVISTLIWKVFFITKTVSPLFKRREG